MASRSVTLNQHIEGTPAAVWFALTHNVVLTQWMCDSASIAAEDGGRFYVWWNEGWYASGVFTTVQEAEQLALSWHGLGEHGPSDVTISLAAADGGTALTLVHAVPEGDEWQEHLAGFESNWAALLENLKFTVERGLDKRVFDRPFLGIMINGLLNEDGAARLGLPEHGKWVHISGTVDGTGAQAAGLQQDDVLVSMSGRELVTFNDLTAVLDDSKAGDEVKLEIYRGGEKQALSMKLSHRPQPEIPPTLKESAAAIREANAAVSAELAALFAEASEAHAAQRPDEKEWSAREVVAHLLMNERWYHLYVSTTVTGQRVPGYSNDLGTVAAIAASYPTTAELLAAFSNALETSVLALEGLPAEVLERKYDYVNLVQAALQNNPQHTRGHYPQIEQALQAARGEA